MKRHPHTAAHAQEVSAHVAATSKVSGDRPLHWELRVQRLGAPRKERKVRMMTHDMCDA